MAPSQKTLYLLRHAKAEAGSAAKDDHDRVLIPRGLKASEIVGKYMTDAGIRPEKILCSTALRARQTCEKVERQYPLPLREGAGGGALKKMPPSLTLPLKGGGNIEYTPKLYLASANETLQLIGKTPESVHSLMIVGHNPGLHQLATVLAHEGDKRLLELLHLKFPTAALATLTFSGTWHGIARAKGTLTGFVMPDSL